MYGQMPSSRARRIASVCSAPICDGQIVCQLVIDTCPLRARMPEVVHVFRASRRALASVLEPTTNLRLKMAFVGLRDVATRVDIVILLRSTCAGAQRGPSRIERVDEILERPFLPFIVAPRFVGQN